MKIIKVSSEYIKFDNGSEITFEHYSDCCEYNYADFEQIEQIALSVEFGEQLFFEKVDGSGFRFGSKGTDMFFIPCYSDQNGYYSSDLDIFFNGIHIMNLEAEMKY